MLHGKIAMCLAALLLILCSAVVAATSQRTEYVADIDHWRVELYAGAANPGGVLQGPAVQAGVSHGMAMCFLPDGEAFLAGGGVILTITREQVVRLVAGSSRPGYRDGPAPDALLGQQLSICPDNRGGVYIGDRSNRCVRRLSRSERGWGIATVAGDPAKAEWKERPVDGAAREAVFKYLHSNVIADEAGVAYAMDSNFLRRVAVDGRVETLNPQGGQGPPSKEEKEPLAAARFSLIMGGGMCFGGDGRIYIADRWNHCIRQVDLKEGVVRVAVGPGTGYRDGPEKQCGFHDSPGSIVYDPYRKRFYTNGVDDWALRVWERGSMKTIAGGNNANKGFEGPAKQASIHWAHVKAVDPRPPHDVYFGSGGAEWQGRIGKLTQKEGRP